MSYFKPLLTGAALASLLVSNSFAASGTITFDDAGLEKGRIVTTEWDLDFSDSDTFSPWDPDPAVSATYDVFASNNALLNLRIQAHNLGDPGGDADNHPNLGVLFDADHRNDPFQVDNDLVGEPGGNLYDVGNLVGKEDEIHNILILQEDGGDGNNNGWLDVAGYNPTGNGNECESSDLNDTSDANPCTNRIDDEGDQPAGYFSLNFSEGIRRFGFDLIDVEGPDEFNFPPSGIPQTRADLFDLFAGLPTGYAAAGLDDVGNVVSFMSYADLINPLSQYYDSSIEFGNNSANRVKPIAFSSEVTEIVISMGGSGGIDNFFFDTEPVPEPGTLLLLGTGLVGLVAYKRRTKA